MPRQAPEIHRIPAQAHMIDRLRERQILPRRLHMTLIDVNRVVFGDDVELSDFSRHRFLPEPGRLQLSSLGYMSYSHSFLQNFRAGNFCSIAAWVEIMGESHPIDRVSTSPVSYGLYYRGLLEQAGLEDPAIQEAYEVLPEPVTCGHDVWIGARATLKGGVRIGHGAVIAANATVTCDVPPYTIWGGLPARQIRRRFSVELSERLLATEWWDYPLETLGRYSFRDPAAFCDAFEKDMPNLQKRVLVRFTAADILTWHNA